MISLFFGGWENDKGKSTHLLCLVHLPMYFKCAFSVIADDMLVMQAGNQVLGGVSLCVIIWDDCH